MYIKEIDANVFVVPQDVTLYKAIIFYDLQDANLQVIDNLEEYYYLVSRRIHTRKYEFDEIHNYFTRYDIERTMTPEHQYDRKSRMSKIRNGIKDYFNRLEQKTKS